MPHLSDAFDVDLGDIDDDRLDPADIDELEHDVAAYLDAIAAAAATYRGDDDDGGADRARHVDDRAARNGAYDGTAGASARSVARDGMIATALAEFTIGAAFIGGTIVGAAMTLALLRIVRRQG